MAELNGTWVVRAMSETGDIFLLKSMRSHPAVAMGNTPRPDPSASRVYSKWEAWMSLQCEPFVKQTFPSANSIRLEFVGLPSEVTNVASIFGWRTRDARLWIADLLEADLISVDLSSALLAKIAKRSRERRDVLPNSSRSAVLAKTSGKCVYCGVSITATPGLPNSYHADHVLPVKSGGADAIANLVPSCRSCNLKKGAKTISDLLRWGDGE